MRRAIMSEPTRQHTKTTSARLEVWFRGVYNKHLLRPVPFIGFSRGQVAVLLFYLITVLLVLFIDFDVKRDYTRPAHLA